MVLQVIALFFLVFAIVLGFVKNINVGIVSMGLALVLGLIGGVDTNTILSGFPGKLFVTLLGTMFFFCLLQENKTLELMSKKMVSAVGKCTFLVPVIIYLVSYILSAAGPGAISVQSVMIIFAVSLASQMDASLILMGVTKIMGGIDLLSEFLSKLMNRITAVPVISLTAGLMSWFSSANGVVLPTLIPTMPGIVENLGNTVTVLEMIMGIVGGATVAGISPLSTGGSLILATYTQEMKASEKEQKKIFLQLFATSFAAVLVVVVFGLLGGFKLFG